MSEQEKEKPKVTVDDVVELLAKHSATPNDPDDADTLSRFNQQVIDERTERETQGDKREKETPTESRGVKPSTARKEGGS
jgi:hypothetical protein